VTKCRHFFHLVIVEISQGDALSVLGTFGFVFRGNRAGFRYSGKIRFVVSRLARVRVFGQVRVMDRVQSLLRLIFCPAGRQQKVYVLTGPDTRFAYITSSDWRAPVRHPALELCQVVVKLALRHRYLPRF